MVDGWVWGRDTGWPDVVDLSDEAGCLWAGCFEPCFVNIGVQELFYSMFVWIDRNSRAKLTIGYSRLIIALGAYLTI